MVPFERQKRFPLLPFDKEEELPILPLSREGLSGYGDDVPYLVTCIGGYHNNDTDLMKLHAEKLSGRKWHLEKTSGFLLGLSWQSSQGKSRRQTRAK